MSIHRLGLLGLCAMCLAVPPMIHAQTASPTGQKSSTKSRVRDGYSLAFVDADVRRVADAVLGSMLGLQYSVDPAVQGNVTLRTQQPVSREQLLPLLETALRSVNAALIVQGSSYRVVPLQQARTAAPVAPRDLERGQTVAGYATEVVTLSNASAPEIARLLQQFLGKDIVSGTNAGLNQVIITGAADEREAARALIERFDVDALAGMNFESYRLENVDAETLVAELDRIFQPPFDIIGSRVRLVPLPRLRSIMAIAIDRNDLARIEPWIRRLDSGPAGKRKLYSYAVQYGRARQLATSLQLVLGTGGPGLAGTGLSSPVPNLGLPTPTSSSSGLSEGFSPMIVERAEPEPSDVIGAQTPLPGQETPMIAGTGTAGPRIVPNEETNSLLIYANGEEYELIQEALDKLDQPVAQVLIEATLAEVTLSNDFRFGVDFRTFGDRSSVINSSNTTGIPSPILPGYSVSILGNSASAVLNSLQSRTNVRVLSAPKLIVLNNQTATLQVGDQVPIVTQQSQSVAAPGAPIVNNIELRDTGVILKVTPRVNERGSITLDIAQEVSDVAETTSSGINSPTIQQRRIASTVATRSGQMVALGGLIRDRSTRGKSGIPLLSQIPVIGGLFGTYTDNKDRTELIILLTPTVIRSPDEVQGVVDALIEGLDSTRPLVERARQGQVNVPPPQQ